MGGDGDGDNADEGGSNATATRAARGGSTYSQGPGGHRLTHGTPYRAACPCLAPSYPSPSPCLSFTYLGVPRSASTRRAGRRPPRAKRTGPAQGTAPGATREPQRLVVLCPCTPLPVVTLRAAAMRALSLERRLAHSLQSATFACESHRCESHCYRVSRHVHEHRVSCSIMRVPKSTDCASHDGGERRKGPGVATGSP